MIFTVLFLFGLAGIVIMTVLGGLHGSHHGGDHGGHAGHADFSAHHHADFVPHHGAAHAGGHAGPVGHAHAGAHGHADHAHGSDAADARGLKIPFILSPLNIFSFCFAAGAVGLLVQPLLSLTLTWLAACAGGFLLTFGIIRPMFSFAMKFVSNPSEGLEGMLAQGAQAMTNFDPEGRGLVKMTLDGEVVQLLGMLDSGERQLGVRVNRGDQLVIVQVDSAKGTCVVSRELSG